MRGSEQSFVAALARGEKEALERFYVDLAASEDDGAFWDYLIGLLPARGAAAPTESLPALKRLVRAAGSYDLFLRTAPVPALALFMALAMVFSACNEAAAPGDVAAPPPGVEAESAGAVGATGGAGEAPSDAAAAAEASDDAAGGAAGSAAGPAAKAADVQSMTTEELRAELLTYVNRAELPASEKRRLKRVLKQAKEKKLVDSRSELAELFAKEDPAQIAAALEAMVLFQKPAGIRPRPMTRYKGVDYPDGEAGDDGEAPERLPMMQTLYKGVDFLES